ncbi:hypothetical protein JK165_14110, partial [Acetobacter okinawensis]|uniref:hypothetical protein n=1 Tax=Acetobacter okinawensis TaxID=1076594 RepID=UPI001BAD20B8
ASKSRERRSEKPRGASVRLMIRVVSSLRQITGFRVMGAVLSAGEPRPGTAKHAAPLRRPRVSDYIEFSRLAA